MIIVGAWAVTGHVGPVEAALRLPWYESFSQRAFAVCALIVMLVSWVLFLRQRDPRHQSFWAVSTIVAMVVTLRSGGGGDWTTAFSLALAVAFALAVGTVVTRARISALGNAGAGTAAFAATGALIILISGFDIARDEQGFHFNSSIFIVLSSFLVAFIIALFISTALVIARRHGRLATFHLTWTAILLFASFASPIALAHLPSWSSAGPILLFLVLLTVLNAPFDWLTLGLTRALFRRGLEVGGWMPFVMGVIDSAIAILAVVLLSFITLLSVQMFEQLALRNGGEPIVDITTLLHALADPEQRWRPEYAWIYAMLFWTLFPSVINVALGSLSALRGLPGVNGLVAKRMQVGKAVVESERLWMAPVLTFQVMLSGLFGLAVIVALFWLLWNWELPLVGSNLLSLLQATADANLPLELLRRMGVSE